MSYHSFLICFHEHQIDVYQNGLPLGLVRYGVFHPHHHKLANGEQGEMVEVPIELTDQVRLVLTQMDVAREATSGNQTP